jgi:hypothetical protein
MIKPNSRLAHERGFAAPHFAADEVLAKSVQPQNVVYLARCTKSGPKALKAILTNDYGEI